MIGTIVVWLVVGLIAGFLARLVIPGREPGPDGMTGDLVAGVVGGIVGGWLFQSTGYAGVTGINLGSIGVAFIGAVVFLLVCRAVVGSNPGHHHQA